MVMKENLSNEDDDEALANSYAFLIDENKFSNAYLN